VTIEELRDFFESKNYKATKDEIISLVEVHKHHVIEKYGKDIISSNIGYDFLDGTSFLNGSNRIVIGGHGPYVEFNANNLECEILIPEKEKWRLDEKYNVKYFHMQPINREEKIYYQIKEVDYADYQIDCFYIDLYLLTPKV